MYNSNIERFGPPLVSVSNQSSDNFCIYQPSNQKQFSNNDQCATKCCASNENDKLACTVSCINSLVCPSYCDKSKGENVNQTGCDFGKNILNVSNQYGRTY